MVSLTDPLLVMYINCDLIVRQVFWTCKVTHTVLVSLFCEYLKTAHSRYKNVFYLCECCKLHSNTLNFFFEVFQNYSSIQ